MLGLIVKIEPGRFDFDYPFVNDDNRKAEFHGGGRPLMGMRKMRARYKAHGWLTHACSPAFKVIIAHRLAVVAPVAGLAPVIYQSNLAHEILEARVCAQLGLVGIPKR